jgi:hypothetical protein
LNRRPAFASRFPTAVRPSESGAEWLLWVDTVEELEKMKDPENRHKVRCDLEDEENEEMTRNEALALYRPIRASMRRILSLYEQKYSVPSRAISARPPRRWNSFMPPLSRSAAPFRLRRRRIAILIYVECK